MATPETSDNTKKAEAEKVEIDKILSTDIAKRLIAEAKRGNETSVVGDIKNNRGRTLELVAATNWTGNFFEPAPVSVGAGATISFSHNGSKGAFIYAETGTSNNAAYLLAWSFVTGPFGVYVKCGPVSEVFYPGWESAALSVLNSSSFIDYFGVHDGTSSSAEAHIRNATGSFPLGTITGKFA